MAKLRLLFVKEGSSSYISNLDLLRTFQRVFPRTGLEIKHTQGFHPHPIISFPLPLPVGQSSDCEIMDFEVTQENYPQDVPSKLNEGMPAGIKVLDCYPTQTPSKDLALIKVELVLEYDNGYPAGILEVLDKLFHQEEIVIEKRTKHKDLAEVNIAPMISSIEFSKGTNRILGIAVLQAQNPGLNPQYLLQAIEKYIPKYAPNFMKVRRKELFKEDFTIFR